jgi:hypothetical protein
MNKHIITNDKSMIRLLGVAIVAIVMMGFVQNGHAAPIVYIATLNGASESPPNASPGTGFAEVDFDLAAHTMVVHVTFSGLLTGTTASHIHAPTAVAGTGTAGVATTVPTFTAFPLGVTSGTYDHLFDMSLASSYNPAFVTANGGTVASAEAVLAESLAAGTAYLNIHTTGVPTGEIRGFLAVPEPATLVLLGLGLIGAAGIRRKPGN